MKVQCGRVRTALVGFLRLAGLALATLLAACSHPRYYAAAEERLGTAGHFAAQGHFAPYYPAEIALGLPAYVVGIEMSPRTAVLREGDLEVERFVHAGKTMTRLVDKLRFGPPASEAPAENADLVPIVSHVLRYAGLPQGAGNCALYSVYQPVEPDLMAFCDGIRRPQIDDWRHYGSAFADSWSAIDVLKESVLRDASTGRYTHLVVVIMGWRTPQEEAIRNFNSIARTMQIAAKGELRPLFIGITWVGPWAGRWLDPLIESLAYGNIAELADALGLSWVGVLTDEVVLPLSRQLSTVFITHSFGARAASTAICIGPAIRRDKSAPARPVEGRVDRLIGLQAAFSLQRFEKDPLLFFYEDVYFPNDCGRVRSIVLTTSRHDTATKAILWADLAGNSRYARSFCRKESGRLASCVSVDETGAVEGTYDETRKILYLDATKLISYRAPGTDGGAHSDIFRAPMGRLLWSLIAKRPRD